MTTAELNDILKTTGMPVAYHHFKNMENLPAIVFYRIGNDNLFADDGVFVKFEDYVIELYTKKKDPKTEKKLEDVLDNNGICYDISGEAYIKDEDVFQIGYIIQIQGG